MKRAIAALVLATAGVLALSPVATAATSAPAQKCTDAKKALADLKASNPKPNPLVAKMIEVYTQQVKNSCGP